MLVPMCVKCASVRPFLSPPLSFRSMSAFFESRTVSVPVGGGKKEHTPVRQLKKIHREFTFSIYEGEDDVIHLSRVQKRRRGGGGGGAEIGYALNRAEAAGEGELDSGREVNRPKGSVSPLH